MAGRESSVKRTGSSRGGKESSAGKAGGSSAKGSKSGGADRRSQADSGRRKDTTGKADTRKKREIQEEPEEEVSFRGEIAVWVVGACMLIVELANFGFCGAVTYISNFFFGLFGVIQYIIPIAILFSAFFLHVNEYSRRAVQKVVFGFIVLLCIGMISQMMEGMGSSEKAKDFVQYLYNSGSSADGSGHIGGGVFCGLLAFLLNKAVGKAGTYIIIILAMIICVLLFTEISLIDGIRSFTEGFSEGFSEAMDEEDEFEEYDRKAGRRRKQVRDEEDEPDAYDRKADRKGEGEKYSDSGDYADENEGSDRSSKRTGKNRRKNNNPELSEIVIEDYSDGRRQSETGTKGSLLESLSVLPEEPSAGKMHDIDRRPDGEEVHEIKMSYPLNLPGENMDIGDGGQAFKSGAKNAADNVNSMNGTKSVVPVVLPANESAGVIHTPDELNMTYSTMSGENMGTGPDYREENVTEASMTYNAYDDYEDSNVVPMRISDRKKSGAGKSGNSGGGAKSPSVKKSGRASASEQTGIGDTLTGSEKEAVMNMENRTVKEEKNLAAKEVGSSDSEYKFPPLELLQRAKSSGSVREEAVKENAIKLQEVLKSFGVNVTMTNYSCGPSVTRYEMVPEQGVKVSKITGLADDIMMNLAAQSIRIEAPIPGKSAVGIEIPNGKRSGVGFRELIDTEKFIKHPSKIAFAVGKDIEGNVVVEDIAKMPHLLIAGATGSGKSVCTNTLIMSILYKARPDEVKLILVDPKQVELKVYNGIPHLLTPVVTDPKKAAGALNWAVAEMTDRYQKFSECNVRNIQGYNEKVKELAESGDIEDMTITKMPQIVIIVDELADLMMVAKAEVEEAIVRLAQLARAAGIHLVIATQRPSVDVVTGLIKANVPSRIALSVSSGIDSRTIIDTVGAEKLLGNGDMLFYPTMYPKPLRVQGAYISDDEVVNVVEFLKANNGETTYSEEMTNQITSSGGAGAGASGGDSGSGSDRDDYFVQAGKFIIEKNKASIGMLQRMFKIGFNRAARIMDQLCEAGVVGPEEGTKPRQVLMSEEQFEEYVDEYF